MVTGIHPPTCRLERSPAMSRGTRVSTLTLDLILDDSAANSRTEGKFMKVTLFSVIHLIKTVRKHKRAN